MTARNDHTGDAIRTRPEPSKAYEEGFDRIMRECCASFFGGPHSPSCAQYHRKTVGPKEKKPWPWPGV